MVAGLIARIALKTGLGTRTVKAAGVALLIVAMLLGWKIWLWRHDRGVIRANEIKVETRLQASGRAADVNALERREARREAQQEQRKEFDNATRHVPDRGLTDRQRIDLCRELRGTAQYEAVRAVCDPLQAGAAAGAGPERHPRQ